MADASKGLGEHVASGSETLYSASPTADSLHVVPPHARALGGPERGHLRSSRGGGTVSLDSERKSASGANPRTRPRGAERLKRKVSPFSTSSAGGFRPLADNYEWISELDVLSLLRGCRQHLAGRVLAKESVKTAANRHFYTNHIRLKLRFSLMRERLYGADGGSDHGGTSRRRALISRSNARHLGPRSSRDQRTAESGKTGVENLLDPESTSAMRCTSSGKPADKTS